jgi:hypothetical protein
VSKSSSMGVGLTPNAQVDEVEATPATAKAAAEE